MKSVVITGGQSMGEPQGIICPSERSPTQKATYCRFHVYDIQEKAKLKRQTIDHCLPGMGIVGRC